jgi:kynureninase
MPLTPEALRASPSPLAPHYSHFAVGERLLFTGHSHQAWPDRALRGQQRAFLDAAELADRKWERAFERAERVRRGFRALLDDPDGLYTLGTSTHELLVRLLSALPLADRPRLVTTDGEFYSLRRQADRLAEEGVEIVRVPALPAASVGERLAAATCDRTAAVLTSTVFYRNAHIAGDLSPAAAACRRVGAPLVLDVYHQLNVVPFSLRRLGLEDAFVVGGGYKYCQLGEGNCFLRFPAGCRLRPVITGWFAEFGELTEAGRPGRVGYVEGDDRFAGATYDPTSHYRAGEVFDFFAEQGLEPELLRSVSQHQIGLLWRRFDALDLDPAIVRREGEVELERLAGFLALESPRAGALHEALRRAGVLTDFRHHTLRFGPAPYTTDEQIDEAMAQLGAAAGALDPARP